MQSYTYIYIHVLPILTCDDLFPKPPQHLYSTSPDLFSTTPVPPQPMIPHLFFFDRCQEWQ